MSANKMDTEEFKFPDEKEEVSAAADDFEIEIEDDTPEEDRDRKPIPQDMVKELDEDELENYTEEVKSRISKMKKVYHDERREKEQALREQQEAIAYAKQMQEENRALKGRLSTGEQYFIDTYKSAAELELDSAKRDYKDAYDQGDSDRLLEAQEKLSQAQYKIQKAKEFVPSRQPEQVDVQPATNPAPRPDQRAIAWQERNEWFGKDEEMTSLALGLHQKLVSQYGTSYPSTDEYWKKVDETMKRRFPENFGDREEEEAPHKTQRPNRPASVVASADRSTPSKKVRLKQSQVLIAKKLGLTPEQYVREMMKLEASNG
jgi:hypothetical protein